MIPINVDSIEKQILYSNSFDSKLTARIPRDTVHYSLALFHYSCQQERVRGTGSRRKEHGDKDPEETGGAGAHREAAEKSTECASTIHGRNREVGEGTSTSIRSLYGEV